MNATARLRPIRARLTRQGQVTVPKLVRDLLGARPGDDLEFEAEGDRIVLRRRARPSVLDFAGIAADRALAIPPTAEALDERIAAAWTAGAEARESRIRASVRRRR